MIGTLIGIAVIVGLISAGSSKKNKKENRHWNDTKEKRRAAKIPSNGSAGRYEASPNRKGGSVPYRTQATKQNVRSAFDQAKERRRASNIPSSEKYR